VNLRDLVIQRAETTPDAPALKGPDGTLTYGALDRMANRFAHALAGCGVQPGERVGIWLDKSPAALAAMQGVLRLRAIYVPLDPLSPAPRIGTIIRDCDIRVLITTRRRAEQVCTADLQHVRCLCPQESASGLTWNLLAAHPATPVAVSGCDEHEVAYILYTSGSTGKPKGVCISHRNALAFVAWATQILQAQPHDRFANHAPLHFDLSVLDIYAAFAAGAMVFLLPDTVSFLPHYLVDCIVQEQLTVWYSVPSVLTLMMDFAGLLDLAALPLRAILFAGEPFAVKHLKRLYQRWSATTRLLNLYGPTETNVCTFYEVRHLPAPDMHTVPIGQACSGDRVWARKEDGSIVQPGEKGELLVAGPTVMVGYWGQPEQGEQAYATGDLVQLQDNGMYLYLGRLDQMLKVRGHRIEPHEIETTLEQHPAVAEVAVLAAGQELESRLIAFIVAAAPVKPRLLELKRHCAERLPRYMIIDEVHFVSEIPRTRNGKIDRLALFTSLSNESRKIAHAAH
jgi:amino acid adenylation domain-containing protein